MNERMNQLHTEAARYAKEKYPNDIVEWAMCMSEKFAELIVKECAKALDEKLANPNGASMAYCDGSDLLEYFGVKE